MVRVPNGHRMKIPSSFDRTASPEHRKILRNAGATAKCQFRTFAAL